MHLNGRSLKSVVVLRSMGLVTFEATHVAGRTIKGRSEIVVQITTAGAQYFLRKQMHH